MTREQWEKRVILPGLIVFFIALYVAAFLFLRYAHNHENKEKKAPHFTHKGDRQ